MMVKWFYIIAYKFHPQGRILDSLELSQEGVLAALEVRPKDPCEEEAHDCLSLQLQESQCPLTSVGTNIFMCVVRHTNQK